MLIVVPGVKPPILASEKNKNNVCKLDGCDRPLHARGLCKLDHRIWLNDPANQPDIKPRKGYSKKTCSAENCNSPILADGHCLTHYRRPQAEKYSPEVLEKIREREAEYRRDVVVFKNAAKDAPCMDCGVRYPPYVMDFDHRDPTEKKMAVSRAKTLQAAADEIQKCDLVCSNCHRQRTFGPGGPCASWLRENRMATVA